MEFWGVEVKAGQPLKVEPEVGKLIHVSQAALGGGKREKGSDLVPLLVNINDNKYVVGSLSADKFPQITFDLVFEKEFVLSHDWKNGSVYFCGYMADNPYGDEDDDEFDSEDDEEDFPQPVTENGKVEPKSEEVKPAAAGKDKAAKPVSSAKPKVTVAEPKKEESDSDDSSDDDDEDMVGADSDDISGSDDDDDDSEDDDDSDDSDEETPKKVDEETPKKPVDKKRPNESASRTPVPSKKGKVDSSQKTDRKKGGHVATPYPSKKAEKAPAVNKQTPKSDAKFSRGSSKKFKKAKHAAK